MSAIAKVHKPDDGNGDYLARLDGMDAEQLRKELLDNLGLSARNLVKAAQCWVRLERMGVDLSGIRDRLTCYLSSIAAGVVRADLVAGFLGFPSLLKKLAALPPHDQEATVNGEPVLFVVKPGEVRMLPIRAMVPAKVNQVIEVAGNIASFRGEAAQIAYLSRQAAPAWKPGKPVTVGNVTVDRARGVVKIGRSEASAADVIKALQKQGYLP